MLTNLTFNFSGLVQRSAVRQEFVTVLFMPYNIEVFLLLVVTCVMSWFIHEAMHYITANNYKLKPYYGWDRKGSFVSLRETATPIQKRRIVENGIIVGLLPIAFVTLAVGLWSLIPLALYLIGCGTDIKYLIHKRPLE
jgi:hypothetical protein